MAKVLNGPSSRSIIKHLDIDDFEISAVSADVRPEVYETIYDVISQGEKAGEYYINDISFRSVPSIRNGHTLMQIEPYPLGKSTGLRLVVNKDIVSGASLEEIDSRVARTRSIVAQNLREAVIHETGHAKLIYRYSISEIDKLYKELKNEGITGISRAAESDGTEAIAEIEIR